MIIAVWIVSGMLALVYVIAGGVKVVASRETVQSRLSWTRHARVWQVKAVGTIEVLAAIGLVAPPLTHILPILAAVPPRVEYAVTELGRTILPAVKALANWALEHGREIQDNRDRFDDRLAGY